MSVLILFCFYLPSFVSVAYLWQEEGVGGIMGFRSTAQALFSHLLRHAERIFPPLAVIQTETHPTGGNIIFSVLFGSRLDPASFSGNSLERKGGEDGNVMAWNR